MGSGQVLGPDIGLMLSAWAKRRYWSHNSRDFRLAYQHRYATEAGLVAKKLLGSAAPHSSTLVVLAQSSSRWLGLQAELLAQDASRAPALAAGTGAGMGGAGSSSSSEALYAACLAAAGGDAAVRAAARAAARAAGDGSPRDESGPDGDIWRDVGRTFPAVALFQVSDRPSLLFPCSFGELPKL